ncbi:MULTISPECIES: TnsD family Tn7-like transposition protein [unclassified Sutcliffiella]|uniref:TnsD family Tn7-like transposition protein n=1 Tax=unclassified Sutcliffiella TaxID=2837532 RepID=UPI0030D0CB1C
MNIFPEPHQGEMLYSVISRYHIISGNGSVEKHTLKDLFESESKNLKLDFSSNIGSLYKKTKIFNVKETSEDWIIAHTSYCYYMYFMQAELRKRVLKEMIEDNYYHFQLSTGKTASRIKDFPYLRFCRSCAEEDMAKFGYSYWRILHQLPGVLVCPIHNEYIQMSDVNKIDKEFVLINSERLKSSIDIGEKNNEKESLIDLSKLIHEIIDDEGGLPFASELPEIYRNLLKQLGFGKYQKVIKTREVAEEIISYYGDVLIDLGFNLSRIGKQLASLWTENKRNKHPLFHLILINFLYYKMNINRGMINIKGFLENGLRIKDTALVNREYIEEKLVCLNHHCMSYKTNTGASIKTYVSNQTISSTYSCNICGMSYVKKGSDFDTMDYTWDLLHFCGHMLAEKINYLYHIEKHKIYTIAKILGIPENSVRYCLEQKKKPLDIKYSVYDQEKDRSDWFRLVENNPGFNITEIKKLNYPLYKRLYNNDKEWLNSLTYHKKTRQYKPIVNWEQRDEEYLARARISYLELFSDDNDPKRITLTSILRKANIKLHKNHFPMLPKTYSFLKEHEEEREDFYLRRAKTILDTQRTLPIEQRYKRKTLSHKVGYFNVKCKKKKQILKSMVDDFYE